MHSISACYLAGLSRSDDFHFAKHELREPLASMLHVDNAVLFNRCFKCQKVASYQARVCYKTVAPRSLQGRLLTNLARLCYHALRCCKHMRMTDFASNAQPSGCFALGFVLYPLWFSSPAINDQPCPLLRIATINSAMAA